MPVVSETFCPSVRTLILISAGDMHRKTKGAIGKTFIITTQQKPGDGLDISYTLVGGCKLKV